MIKEIIEADKIIDELNNVDYERVKMLETKLEKVTSDFSDNRVDGGRRLHSREDALLLYAELTKQLDDADKKMKEIYKNIKDRDLKIYFEKRYLHMTNAQLELKWGIGKRQINKICKKIKKKHYSSP